MNDDFELPDFNIFDTNIEDFFDNDAPTIELDHEAKKSKIFNPTKVLKFKQNYLQYAIDVVDQIELTKDFNMYAIVSGAFVLGDLLELFLTTKKIRAKNMYINTLSVSDYNINRIKKMIQHSVIKDSLKLILSVYFYNLNKQTLIPLINDSFNYWSNFHFDFAVTNTHTKIAMVELENGQKWIFQGSGNLRSSGSQEQIQITESEELYDFYVEYNEQILQKFSIINREVTDPLKYRFVRDTKHLKEIFNIHK